MQLILIYNALFNSSIAAGLTTPMNLAVGLAYQFTPKFLLSADFQYIGWSSYDALVIDFDSPVGTVTNVRDYKNTYITRLGAEYRFTNTFAMQGGVYYDMNPVEPERNSPSLPESDRLGLSLGLSYRLTGALGAQLSYLYVYSTEQEIDNSQEIAFVPGRGAVPFNGTYNSSANVLSISLTYGF
jgi:long-chain fatty acid transport protein